MFEFVVMNFSTSDLLTMTLRPTLCAFNCPLRMQRRIVETASLVMSATSLTDKYGLVTDGAFESDYSGSLRIRHVY